MAEESRAENAHYGPAGAPRAGQAGTSGGGLVQPLLTAGSPQAAALWESQKVGSTGSKKNTGAGGTDVDTHVVACTQKIFADVLQP